jgi:hypothetical protein
MLDPMGAVQQGVQLGKMGLEVQTIAQDLRQKFIAEQEAKRALGMKQFEDNARRTLADLLSRHTKQDANGKMVTDYDAALAEGRTMGLDPTYLAEIEAKKIANESASLKTGAERGKYLSDFLTDTATQLRSFRRPDGTVDEEGGKRFLEQKVQTFSRATRLPLDEVRAAAEAQFGAGIPGASLVRNATAIADAIAISPQQERENIAAGLSPGDLDAKGPTSTAARQFLAQSGINVPANMNLPQMRQHPLYGPKIKEWELRVQSTVPSAETRAGQIAEAAELDAKRKTLNTALKLESQLRQVIGTRVGSMAQEAVNKWLTQSGKRAVAQAALDLVNKELGTNLTIADLGNEATFARIRAYEGELRAKQTAAADVAATSNLQRTAETQVPKEVQKERDRNRVGILRQEYDKTVELLRARPNDRSLQVDLDSIARQLAAEKVKVPGSSDVLRSFKEPPKPRAEKVIFVMKGRPDIVIGEAERGSAKYERMKADSRLEIKR